MKGATFLEALPYPENLDHHFVVDPAKFDYYAMDCYRLLGENALARTYAGEVLRIGTDVGGYERAPMRNPLPPERFATTASYSCAHFEQRQRHRSPLLGRTCSRAKPGRLRFSRNSWTSVGTRSAADCLPLTTAAPGFTSGQSPEKR